MRTQGQISPNHIVDWQVDNMNAKRSSARRSNEMFVYQMAEYGIKEANDKLGFCYKEESTWN